MVRKIAIGMCIAILPMHAAFAQFAPVVPDVPPINAGFGQSVATDGTVLVVGANFEIIESPAVGPHSVGAAYVFEGGPGAWQQVARLTPDPASILNFDFRSFGWSVALDANSIAIGAPLDRTAGISGAGSVTMYRRVGGSWQFEQQLLPVNPNFQEQFGYSVALRGDRLLVGARGDRSTNTGWAYLYERTGSAWSRVKQFVQPNPQTDEGFGRSVSLGDEYAFIAAPGRNINNANDSGAVFVYKNNEGAWNLVQTLTIPDGQAGALFGQSVATDGQRALVGAMTAGDMLEGRAFAYALHQEAWVLTQTMSDIDPTPNGWFGAAVDIRGDKLIIGAPEHTFDDGRGGTAYVYQEIPSAVAGVAAAVRDGAHSGQWKLAQEISSSTEMVRTEVGWSVSLGDGVVATGALSERVDGQFTGAAYTVPVLTGEIFDYLQFHLLEPRGGGPTIERMTSEGSPAIGLAADGVARLLIRSPVYDEPFEMHARISDELGVSTVDAAGQLLDPFAMESNPDGTELTVASMPVQSPTPGHQAFAWLQAPEDFVREGVADDLIRGKGNPRELLLKLTIGGIGQSALLTSYRTVGLHRPPVGLVHGLEDFYTSFNFELQNEDSVFEVTTADYGSTHASPFNRNDDLIRDFLASDVTPGHAHRAHAAYRAQGIASIQADIVAHSMGGILTRRQTVYLVRGVPYENETNYEMGSINKLITIGTPHLGSQIASMMIAPGGGLSWYGYVLDQLEFLEPYWTDCCATDGPRDDRTPGAGATHDLRPDSAEIVGLNSRTMPGIPVHAIIGVGGSQMGSHCYRDRTLNAFRMCRVNWNDLAEVQSELFSEAHDAVVAESSARGGLTGAQVTTLTGDDGLHWPMISGCGLPWGASTARGPAETKVEELLHASVDDPMFASGFPAVPIVMPHLPEPCVVETIQAIPDAISTLQEIAGEIIWEVLPSPEWPTDFLPDQVIVVIDGVLIIIDQAPPVMGSFFRSADAFGPVEMRAAVVDSGQGMSSFAEQTLPIDDPVMLTALSWADTTLTLTSIEPTAQPRLFGHFDDGSVRDVTGMAGVISYAVQPADVVKIDPDGSVEAIGTGHATLTAIGGGFTADLWVTVESLPADWNGDGEFDDVDAAALAACMGSESGDCLVIFDADNDGVIDCIDVEWLASHFPEPAAVLSATGCRACAGDTNGDNIVDIIDLNTILGNFQQTGSPGIPGDLNRDGQVNVTDLNVVLGNFQIDCSGQD